MKEFGFFEGMAYGDCHEDFKLYEKIKNNLKKADILQYLKSLEITCIAPMFVLDIFTGEPLELAGLYEDGNFRFPIDFVHYYEKYDIGIPVEYEKYIASRIH